MFERFVEWCARKRGLMVALALVRKVLSDPSMAHPSRAFFLFHQPTLFHQ